MRPGEWSNEKCEIPDKDGNLQPLKRIIDKKVFRYAQQIHPVISFHIHFPLCPGAGEVYHPAGTTDLGLGQ